MSQFALQTSTDPERWNELVSSLNGGILQSWQWGELKGAFGWEPRRFIWEDGNGNALACAQVLVRRPSLPLTGRTASIVYCPRGPLLDWSNTALQNQVLHDLEAFARQRSAIFLKLDPDIITGRKNNADAPLQDEPSGLKLIEDLTKQGFQRSASQIQFANTMVLDLHHSLEDLLAAMKQKTRYNIRLAGRKGVSVRQGSISDIDLLYKMYAQTSIRDGFVIRQADYYHMAWGKFIQAGLAKPFIAEVKGEPIAAIIIYRLGAHAVYMYGMSTEQHRNMMPNYLLQWEAIQWAKACGCQVYDFWGAPDEISPDDSMWGVYRFKLGFGAAFIRTPGAWDLILRPALYTLYTRVMPLVLQAMRRKGNAQTREQLDA